MTNELREIGRGVASIVYASDCVKDTVIKVYNHSLRMHDGAYRALSKEEQDYMFCPSGKAKPETLSKEEYQRMKLYYWIYTEETRFLSLLKDCPNIIQVNCGLDEAIKECRLLGIGLERMEKPLSKTNLRTIPASFRRRIVCRYAIQIARGLVAIHERGIAHLDLKPDNILIGFDGVLRISDFGNASEVIPETYDVITCTYRPPEIFSQIPWTDFGEVMKADVWSFGCIVYELYRGRELFQLNWDEKWTNSCIDKYNARITRVKAHPDWFISKSIEGSILPIVDRFTSTEILQMFETLYNTNEQILEHWD